MTDEHLEALNSKYNIARIVRLSTGRFALFDTFANADGIPLLGIGTLDQLAGLIPTASECAERLVTEPTPRGHELLSMLGLGQPSAPAEPLRRL